MKDTVKNKVKQADEEIDGVHLPHSMGMSTSPEALWTL